MYIYISREPWAVRRPHSAIGPLLRRPGADKYLMYLYTYICTYIYTCIHVIYIVDSTTTASSDRPAFYESQVPDIYMNIDIHIDIHIDMDIDPYRYRFGYRYVDM